MPRIPVRVEPYNSPTRQHRHFKSKRDLVLRSLGKAAFINGSQFAIIWVTARGETECYGSDAFQPKLATWFPEGVCADAIHTARQEQLRLASQDGAKQRDYASMLDASDHLSKQHDQQGSAEEGDEERASDAGTPAEACAEQTPGANRAIALTPLDANSADVFGRPARPAESLARAATSEDPSSHAASPALPRGRRRTAVAPYVAPPTGIESVFENETEVTAYLTAKVTELQQNVCKLLAKAWIKVIEPKKPTTHPYAGGDATKPTWWPAHVRHKEPDTLLKPGARAPSRSLERRLTKFAERIDLLVGILGSPYSGLTRLELASGEMSAFIPTHKHAILRDIYNVARGFENMRRIQGGASRLTRLPPKQR
jgi:hypothetical protein